MVLEAVLGGCRWRKGARDRVDAGKFFSSATRATYRAMMVRSKGMPNRSRRPEQESIGDVFREEEEAWTSVLTTKLASIGWDRTKSTSRRTWKGLVRHEDK